MRRPRDDGAAGRVEALYREHHTMVLAVCRGFLRDHVEADDAAQQTFLSAQRALANGSLPREPAAWLATIARNECFARLRSRPGRPLPVGQEPFAAGHDAHADAARRETVVELRAALAALPEQQREAILLREVRGFSYDEVAASMAVSTAAVESLIFRARRQLQLRLREAAAALSPAALLAPLRELAARIGATGLAAPAAAKLVAVGLGTAVVAGGVSVDPHLIGLGHAPAREPAPVPAARSLVIAPASTPAPRVARAAAVTPRRAAPPARDDRAAASPREQTDRGESAVGPGPEDGQEPSSPAVVSAPAVWSGETASSRDVVSGAGGSGAERERGERRRDGTAERPRAGD